MTIISGVGASGTVASASGGKITAFNGFGATPTQVVPANPQRKAITFHNPGVNNVYVFPAVDAQGSAINPILSTPGGAFLIYPGASLMLSGECQVAWRAFGIASFTAALTVMETNV